MADMNILHKKSNTTVDKDREAAWEKKMVPESVQKFECASPLFYHLTTLNARKV